MAQLSHTTTPTIGRPGVAPILAAAEAAGLFKDQGRAAALRDADRLFAALQAYSRAIYADPRAGHGMGRSATD